MSDLGPPAGQHIRPPGWYRVTKDGWVKVAAADADPYDLLGDGFDAVDLVKVEHDAEEVPLW